MKKNVKNLKIILHEVLNVKDLNGEKVNYLQKNRLWNFESLRIHKVEQIWKTNFFASFYDDIEHLILLFCFNSWQYAFVILSTTFTFDNKDRLTEPLLPPQSSQCAALPATIFPHLALGSLP